MGWLAFELGRGERTVWGEFWARALVSVVAFAVAWALAFGLETWHRRVFPGDHRLSVAATATILAGIGLCISVIVT